MSMKISGNYETASNNYAEQVKEKQAAEKAEKVKEAVRGAEEKSSGKLLEPQDEYISSQKSGKEPTGLYHVGKDEDGNPKVFYDDPKAAQGEPEKCVGDTNAVDREIRNLKEKKQELEQQLLSASGDEKRVRELEKKLAQVEQELSQKDNDTYRRQHTVFS